MGMPLHRSCVLLTVVVGLCSAGISFKNGGYEDIVVSIGENVPATHCRAILDNLEATLRNSSEFLYRALDGRAYFNSVTVLLPDAWANNCTLKPVTSFDGLAVDIKIGGNHPVFGDLPWTQQSGGCGEQGDFIHVSYKQLQGQSNLSGMFVREWSKYRYGVFDEFGFRGDVVYPLCYQGDSSEHQVTGCSDRPIHDHDVCSGENERYNTSHLVDSLATSSLMFAPDAPQVVKFCDHSTHDRFAPTKHNFMCHKQSVMEVILQHRDFAGQSTTNHISSPANTPLISYKRRASTRFVLVIEDTQAMMTRDSWSFLRGAVRKFAVVDLPQYTELGLVLVNDSGVNMVHNLSELMIPATRDLVAANIPYTPGDAHGSACIHCGLSQAVQMLEDRATSYGPSASVIVIISPGYTPSKLMDKALNRASKFGIYISTVNYPTVRPTSLDNLARATNGLAFTVLEQRYNTINSYLTTYFHLANSLFNIAEHFCMGQNMPIEIHRRELWDDVHNSVTGSFVLEESLSEPARFTVFTHNVENPLIRGMSLVSPSQVVYSTRSDSMISFKLLTLNAQINETGTWTYTIERFPGNPQPHFVQVFASPRSRYATAVRATAWTDGRVLRATVLKGEYPVLGARVEVVAVKVGANETANKDNFELLDTGSGDPDVTKGDGVYTHVINPKFGPGLYTFQIKVSDNSNNAYSYQEQVLSLGYDDTISPCCGSSIPTPTVRPVSPFMRILPILTANIQHTNIPTGRIGNLKVDILAEQLKARLVFSAPDPQAKRYEIRYSHTLGDIVNSPQSALLWEHGSPFPLAAGAESSYTLDFTRNPSLLDHPLYLCVESIGDEHTVIGPSGNGDNNDTAFADATRQAYRCSNWIRILVPSPPPPPAAITDYPYSSEDPSWTPHAVVPRIAKGGDYGLELILPVAGGICLLALCIAAYCYICVLRRRGEKKKNDKKSVAIQSAIQVVPSSPPTNNLPQQFEPCLNDDNEKKRTSMAPMPYEEKLVDDQIATITPLRQRTLSPYQSWTASQLLHEHERRHSPYGDVHQNPNMSYDQGIQYNSPPSLYGDNQSIQHYYMEQSLRNQYNEANGAPPVPPLPSMNNQMNGIYTSGPIYGVQPGTFAANGYHRNGSLMQFNPSVQGSLSSVSSGDKKKRNVTMV